MKNSHAVALGRLSKGKTSKIKARSSRQNGKLGGRPPNPDWISFMDDVDKCRKIKSVAPIYELFLKNHSRKERALLNSTTKYLCDELRIPVPDWASSSMWLKYPWFVSGVENLKAMAILESPLEFRSNNIFVLGNFLSRV